MTENIMEKKWFVVNTKPVKEFFSAGQLERKGIEAFCPKIKEHYWKKGRVEVRLRPLFPGYIFVHIAIDDDYYMVKWTSGVKKFVGCGMNPAPLKDEIVAFIKGLVNKDGIVSKRKLKKGDRVKVKSGPFKGLIGIVENDIPSSGRVKVLMELINASARFEIAEVLLEGVGY